MNILKIQQDILASLIKGNKLYKFTVDDANVGVVYDNVIAYIIPRDKFLINVERLTDNMSETVGKILYSEKFKDYEKAESRPQLIMPSTILEPNELIQKISGVTKTTWARRKFINQFNRFAKFAINGPKDSIVVYENGVYAGLIMPFKTEITNDEQVDYHV